MLIAQDRSGLEKLDSETYLLYLNQDWKNLINKGTEGLDQGHDFYYLRMRLAMAWYERGRFEKARENLLKALEFTPNEAVANYYLYYSNLFSGRYGEARRLLKTFPDLKKKEMKVPQEFSFSGVLGEAGMFSNNSVKELQESMPQGDFVSSYFMKEMSYLNFSAGVNLGYESNFSVAINQYNTQAIQDVFTGQNLQEFTHEGHQVGLFAMYQHSFAKSWYGGLSVHDISGDYSLSYYAQSNKEASQFNDSIKFYQQFYVGGFVGKHFNYLDVNAHFSKNTFWQGDYFQSGFSVLLYPTGNADYYINMTYDRMNSVDVEKEVEEAWKILAGLKLFKGVFIEGSHITGNLSNWADASGYYLFNTLYPIRSRTGASLVIADLIPHLRFSLSAFITQREHFADVYLPDGSVDQVQQEFSTNSFFGGVSWIF